MKHIYLERGDMVIAIRHLDQEGADVRKGTIGIVFQPVNYYNDDCGPMVRWMNMGACNVYPGDVAKLFGLERIQNPDTGEIKEIPLKMWD